MNIRSPLPVDKFPVVQLVFSELVPKMEWELLTGGLWKGNWKREWTFAIPPPVSRSRRRQVHCPVLCWHTSQVRRKAFWSKRRIKCQKLDVSTTTTPSCFRRRAGAARLPTKNQWKIDTVNNCHNHGQKLLQIWSCMSVCVRNLVRSLVPEELNKLKLKWTCVRMKPSPQLNANWQFR